MKKISVFLIICLCLNIFSLCIFAKESSDDVTSEDVMSAFEQTVLNESYSYEQETEVTVLDAIDLLLQDEKV